ncbi:MAG TPA: response regulator [Chroococcales cyanobacterium]
MDDSAANDGTKKRKLVLVVDDDHVHRRTMDLLSDHLGVRTITVSSCADAITAIRTSTFDVILMDYRMPEEDGISCTRRIRNMGEVFKNTPIIAVTAHIVEDSKLVFLEGGMNDLLAKPFTFEELRSKLSQWLG